MTPLESLVASTLGIPEEDIAEDTGSATSGAWTSLRHVQLVARVEETYGVRLSSREARSCRSLRDLRRILVDKGVEL